MIFRPEINPIRFGKRANYDYVDNFPTLDNLLSNESMSGVLAIPVRQKWTIDKEIVFQIQWTNNFGALEVYAVMNGVETLLIPEDVTPLGFNFNYEFVSSYSYIPSEAGCLYFRLKEYDYLTNYFYFSDFIDVENELKDYLLIEYKDNTNKKGFVFLNNTIYDPTLRIYVKGKLSVIGKDDITSYVDSQGNLNKLSQITRKGRKLEIFGLPDVYATKLNLAISCKELKINGVSYQTEGEFEITNNGNSNTVDLSVDLYMVNWDKGYDDNYIDPSLQNIFTDGVGNIFTDGLGNAFN